MRKPFITITALTVASMFLGACGDLFKSDYSGDRYQNQPPETHLSSGPPEGITDTSYLVEFFWNGFDPDGAVDHYEYIITDDWVTGSLLIDENISEHLESLGYEWIPIYTTDSTFIVEASQIPDFDDPEENDYYYDPNDPNGRFFFLGQHTFFLRAVDEYELADPIPAHRSFTSTTIAPSVVITHPVGLGSPADWHSLPPDVFFTWTGNDSIGNGPGITEPDSTRICIFTSGEHGIDPDEITGGILSLPDSIWTRWRGWDEPEDSVLQISGTAALVQSLTPSEYYLFFIQAKDEAGAITSHYRAGANFKKIRISSSLYPRLYAQEPTLGLTVATGFKAFDYTIGQGQVLNVSWSGSASHYGSRVTGYRYGWDIEDPSEDESWEVNWSLDAQSASRQFISGSHNLYVQCRDYSGTTTTILYRFHVVPFTMERQLLLVDDFDNNVFSEGYPVGEETASWTSNLARNDVQMREFWDEMLADYSQWNPSVDFFRSTSLINRPPFELVATYQNIIWETSRTDRGAALYRIARFVDPWFSLSVPFDYVSAFAERGGGLLICGSVPMVTVMPSEGDVVGDANLGKLPVGYRRHLTYRVGDNLDGVRRYLPYRQFGIDILITPIYNTPRAPLDTAYWPFVTNRTHWGMVGIETTRLELDEFPNQYALPDTLRMSPETLDWFEYAAAKLQNVGGHGYFGVPDAEIYNWNWYAKYLDPDVIFRRDEYIPILNYVVADNKTRFGTEPARVHEVVDNSGRHYNERAYAIPHISDTGDSIFGSAAGVDKGYAVAMIGKPAGTDHRNVVLGFSPYYLEREHAKLLIDHCLIDIMSLEK